MTKLDQAIQFATENMPMKNYAMIVAKSINQMDYNEKVKATSIAGEHKFYATASITVGKKEFIVTEASDADRTGAVCLALARLQMETATQTKAFMVSTKFANIFSTALNQ